MKFHPVLVRELTRFTFAFFAYLLFFPFHLRFHFLHLSFVCPRATENAIMKLDAMRRSAGENMFAVDKHDCTSC